MPASLVLQGAQRNTAFANTQAYRPDIDGLRAVAVLLVVFYHAGFVEISGGFIGVDIFFVISGYLITGIIARELGAGHFTFSNFYARRIKRICPALFTLMGLLAVAALFFLIPADLKKFGSSVASTILFVSNWHFYTQVGYFDGPAIEKPLLHTWSLAIEEQFYFLWPLCLVFLYRFWGWIGLHRFILVFFCISLAASQIVLAYDAEASFYLLPCRAWELLLGAYLAIGRLPELRAPAASAIGAAAFAAIFYAALAFNIRTPFPGVSALLPCLGAAALIYAGLQPRALSHRVLSLGPVRFVGKISYSLYLIHWPLFSFANIYLDHAPGLEGRLAITVLSLALAALSYRYVETPARQTKLRLPAVLRVAVPAGAALVVYGIVCHASGGLHFRVPESVQIAARAHQAGHAAPDRTDCLSGPRPQLTSRPCPIGVPAPDLQYDFVVWGDSHARSMAPALMEQARERNLAGILFWEPSCPPFLGEDAIRPECKQANDRIAGWLATQQKLKLVILIGYWSAHVRDGILTATRPQGEAAGMGDAAQRARVGFGKTVSLLRSLKLGIAVVEDIPNYAIDPTYCAARARMFGRSDEQCFAFPRGDIEKKLAQSDAIVRAASRDYGMPLIETVSAFCEGDTCRTEKDGVIFYGDGHHLNTSGARYLGQRLNIPWPAASPHTSAVALEGVGKEQ